MVRTIAFAVGRHVHYMVCTIAFAMRRPNDYMP